MRPAPREARDAVFPEGITMQRKIRRLGALACVLMLLFSTFLPEAFAAGEKEITILFTHDLHSHFLPQESMDGSESGGYARLKTVIDRERELHPGAILVDGGDFSIGSLIQALYTTDAPELRTMGAMGYDAVTIGNHEFDHKGTGFASMLNAAVDSGDALPYMLEANYFPAPDNPDRREILDAMDRYGVRETLILERGGVRFGIFGLNGVDSDDCAPTSGFVLEDAAEHAKKCVEELKEQGAEVIVCLSHSGTDPDPKKSEDLKLAQAVEGIDVIVSGHTHSILEEPIREGNTLIVSCGPYCSNLGCLVLRRGVDGRLEIADYHLTPIDETLPADPEIAPLVGRWKEKVDG